MPGIAQKRRFVFYLAIALAILGFLWLNTRPSELPSSPAPNHSPPEHVLPDSVPQTNHNIDLEYDGMPPVDLPIADTVETTIPGHAAASGFTMLDQLYMKNGTFYIVTSTPSSFPEKKYVIFHPGKIEDELLPTDEDIQLIHPNDMKAVLGEHIIRLEGFTAILHEDVQFMNHYYHWWGEIILGLWRTYSVLSEPGRSKHLPPPARFMLPNAFDERWRDHAGVDGPLMYAAFPTSSLETGERWNDLRSLGVTIVFERTMIISRASAHRDPLAWKWGKMISSTMALNPLEHFWEPVRSAVTKNVVGYVPKLSSQGAVISPPQAKSEVPVVVYISRQGGGRKLSAEAHLSLVDALEQLEKEGLCEVNVVMMERLNVSEQVAIVSRATIIVGVHGNGLTHQLWMPPNPHSTVFEILYPQSYIFDYEMLARNMGHRHYAVWNDTFLTYPKGTTHPDGVHTGNDDDFHGNVIPVHGPAVAQAIRERLAEPIS